MTDLAPGSHQIARLRQMRWSELERVALEVGLPLSVVRRAATRDELRLAILKQRVQKWIDSQ